MTNGSRPRVLFIARAYPPTVGGMENLALQLSTHMGEHAGVETLINHHGKKALPVFLPAALAVAVARVRGGRFGAVHLADALLAPLGAALKAATGVTVTTSVCGLDVTYKNRAYQALVPAALRRLDHAMPISTATDAAMRARTGVTPLSTVIPLGINPLPAPDAAAIEEFERVALVQEAARVVVTVGRLIERKGAAWFAANVLPHLPQDAVYAVVGEGPMRAAIEQASTVAGVADRVRLTGRLSDRLLAAAYARSDVFVMPNVPVAGDMEGFGLVALEAATCGLPVIAARLEGISDAVHDGRNGTLVETLDAAGFADEVKRVLELPASERRALGAAQSRYALATFGWQETARRYVHVIEETIGRKKLERAA